ncbi:CheR family methyltransferase [Fulvimarina sp. 2208YS6-2-32]|uniref:protein-glutamate O-methyltransferase n=1 Tax=Fulvimarina uroteuthidis TaxID=3098149 RepID=A0ABU5HYI8_9HYPH|nr:CheR family methyltransferase [Fulvimarina sp. 2208YS6-2-32]MDY8107618.1 CheR family methyltransferase [Fulvimarina sp. 2208YS6-2-32]
MQTATRPLSQDAPSPCAASAKGPRSRNAPTDSAFKTVPPARRAIETPGWMQATLDDALLGKFLHLVHTVCGISMAPSKRLMLQTRLHRRLQANGLTDFSSYYALLTSPEGRNGELQAFVDCVVTNETSFFRERPHFDFLDDATLTRLAMEGEPGHLAMWSAACSTGEEAYSMAMVAAAAAARLPESERWRWSVLATDISIKVLAEARRAVYQAREFDRVPASLLSAYVLRARDGASDAVRIGPDLRKHVSFGQINLMHERFNPGRVMDVIFCRNVLIYFDTKTQQEIIARLCRHVRPGGLFILGHADVLRDTTLPLRLVRNNIYERRKD